jgi:YgiT-type zinc finger domain-containing protein
MNRYADCTFCGRQVDEQTIDYDYRRQKHLMIVSNVSAGVCREVFGINFWRKTFSAESKK